MSEKRYKASVNQWRYRKKLDKLNLAIKNKKNVEKTNEFVIKTSQIYKYEDEKK